MIQLLTLLIPLLALFKQAQASSEYLRPQIHLTPEHGWLNDPNGLFYDRKEKLWHAYYQHNPDHSAVWTNQLVWGHSTSKDLLAWKYEKPAIEPEHKDEGIFSGSIVIDKKNTSGFFNDSVDPEHRIVAIYTNSVPKYQTQHVAYSVDGGYSFTKYDQNPVINVTSPNQRDPKVFWHDESKKWIMVVAKTQEYKIQIYSSKDLKKWEWKSDFKSGGYLGFQYECPGLFKLPIENPTKKTNTHKWVLIFAINPGSPLGGSINEYFIGDFDGEKFSSDDAANRFMDIGKDFYAFQTFENTDPEDGVLGLAWATNWQYANHVPTETWRGSMSMVRNYTLRYVDVNPENYALTLIQKPVFDTKETRKNDTLKSIDTVNEYEVTDLKLDKYSNVATDFNSWRNSTGILEFTLKFTQTKFGFSYSNDTTFGIFINSQTVRGTQETLKVAFDALSSSWYVDRSTQHPFQRETSMFTERLSTYVEKMDESDDGIEFSLHGVVDRDILELYFNDGSIAMTSTFFFSQGKIPTSLAIVTDAEESFITINELIVKELGFK